MSDRRPTVVVIGGGVIGLAVAWRMARRGAAVTLLERDRPGSHASSAAAGMLSPLKEADETGPFLDIGLRSFDRYPSFVAELEAASGMEVGYRREGRLDVALDPDGAEALRRQQRLQRAVGHESRILEPGEVRELEPAVSPEAVLGLTTAHDHQVDNVLMLRALWTAASRAGATIRPWTPAADIEIRDGRVAAVRLESGERVPADAAVLAAGPWSGRIALPRPIPVRPVRGQVVVLRTTPPALGRVVWGPGCYLVPRTDGRILVGSTMEEVGFAAEVTAAGVERLLTAALRVAPGLGDAAVESSHAGLRPAAPDGLPIIGRDAEVEGLVHATGHFRNGILLAPETAERVAATVLDDAEDEPAFSPARFQGSEQSRA